MGAACGGCWPRDGDDQGSGGIGRHQSLQPLSGGAHPVLPAAPAFPAPPEKPSPPEGMDEFLGVASAAIFQHGVEQDFNGMGADGAPPEPSLQPGEREEAAEGRPDLTGSWLGASPPEGMDEFLEVMGIGLTARKAACAMMQSRMPKMAIVSEHNGEKFLVANHTPTGLTTTEFLTNGEDFEGMFGPEKWKGRGTARWDGERLVLTVKMSEMDMETTRWLEGENLCEAVKVTKKGRTAAMSRKFKMEPAQPE